ncbi:MAG TPA: ATP-binding protein, partial [Candidatus Thermoplasmatota archaeon]|nr:ATP-binding protein [Candidatus Thermoplasmatota archaeon]
DTVRRVLEQGEPVLWVPLRLLARDGPSTAVLANFSPVFDQGERPARVLVVAHDVTGERRQQLIRDKAFQMARLVSEQTALEPLANRGLVLLLAVVSLNRGAAYVGQPGALREVASANLDGLDARSRAALSKLADDAARAGREQRLPFEDAQALALPLVERGEALGAVVLTGHAEDLSGENLEVLNALSAQLAVGLRRTLFEARLSQYAAELEERVKERTAELTEKTREIESFLYSVSHDLKAPLISIQGYSESLQEDYGRLLEGDGALYLERIRRNASLMESLILDILELSRIGRVRDEIEQVDVEAVVRETAARLADRYAAAGGGVEVAGPLPAVRGERKRLAQLFTNLLDNAVKYRHPERPPRARVSARTRPGEVEYVVEDNGRGIPESARGRLFQMFQRVGAPGLDDPGGTGMGLAIVRRIAETHGGRVEVESREGEGTTFRVVLPTSGARP